MHSNGRVCQNAKVTKCRGVREGKMESNDFLHFVLLCFVVPSVFNPDPPAKFPPFPIFLSITHNRSPIPSRFAGSASDFQRHKEEGKLG